MTVSVVIATYNGEKFLREQINSVLAQTLMPTEIIVCDDGSTDGTWDIIEEYKTKHPNLFRLYHNEGEHGAHNNFKYAFQFVTCDLVAPCDQDDIWMPEKLERSVNAIKDDISFVFCQEKIRHEDGSEELLAHTMPPLYKNVLGNMIAGHIIVCKREFLEVFTIVPEIAFDWGLTLYAAADASGVGIDYVGCVWRRHSSVVTSAYSDHNPLVFEKISKWKKLYRTLWMTMRGTYSAVIAHRMNLVRTLIAWRRAEQIRKTQPNGFDMLEACESMATGMAKQSPISILRACHIYAQIVRNQDSYRNASMKDKVGMAMYAFCVPAMWWYDYHNYDSL